LNNEVELSVFDFRVNPNPATEQVEFSIAEDQFLSLTKPKVRVLDVTGRMHASFLLLDANQLLDIHALPTGIYLMVLESKGSAVGVKKLVKR